MNFIKTALSAQFALLVALPVFAQPPVFVQTFEATPDSCQAIQLKADEQRKALAEKQIEMRTKPMLRLAEAARGFFKSLTKEDRRLFRAYEEAQEDFVDHWSKVTGNDATYNAPDNAEHRLELIRFAEQRGLPRLVKEVNTLLEKKLSPLMKKTNKGRCVDGNTPSTVFKTLAKDYNPEFCEEIAGNTDYNNGIDSIETLTLPHDLYGNTIGTPDAGYQKFYDFPEGKLYGPFLGYGLELNAFSNKFQFSSEHAEGSDFWHISRWGASFNLDEFYFEDDLEAQLAEYSDEKIKQSIAEDVYAEASRYYGHVNTPADLQYVSTGCDKLELLTRINELAKEYNFSQEKIDELKIEYGLAVKETALEQTPDEIETDSKDGNAIK